MAEGQRRGPRRGRPVETVGSAAGDAVSGALRVTIVGSSCSIPRPGRACSSYLFESAGAAIVADLGTGALASLLRTRPAESIDAILISHMHADHFMDVIPMRYALKYGIRTHDRKPVLYLPPGGVEMLRRLTAAFARESNGDFIAEVFEVHTYDPARVLRIGDASVAFAATSHYIPTFAMRCEAAGRSVAYSADTAPDERVVELARDAALFVCESTLSRGGEAEQPRGHISAREAGIMAEKAGVRRLVLTHYPATATAAELKSDAGNNYSGPVAIADDSMQFLV